MNTQSLSLHEPARYRLQLQGLVRADWSDWMPDVEIVFKDGVTVLTGTVHDQAGLFGLLSFVRDRGAPLISVSFLCCSICEKGDSNEN